MPEWGKASSKKPNKYKQELTARGVKTKHSSVPSSAPIKCRGITEMDAFYQNDKKNQG